MNVGQGGGLHEIGGVVERIEVGPCAVVLLIQVARGIIARIWRKQNKVKPKITIKRVQ